MRRSRAIINKPSGPWVVLQWTKIGPSVSRPMTYAQAMRALQLLAEEGGGTEAEAMSVERYLSHHARPLVHKNPLPAAAWAAIEAGPAIYGAGELAWKAGKSGYRAFKSFRDSYGRFKKQRKR